jgi:Ca2+-binding RTX toxin-like protein
MTQSHHIHAVPGRDARLGRQFARVGVALALAVTIGTGGTALAATITGTNAADTINGTAESDTISALGGDDTVNGLGGDDQILGGDGDDALAGDDGNDRISGNNGIDQVSGGAGIDRLTGDAGNDTLDGGDGRDTRLAGGPGKDTVLGGAGNDTLDGDEGTDVLRGGADSDTLFGLDGDDSMSGEAGRDDLFGGLGADVLSGGADADELEGEEAADRIEGGAGDDELDFNAGDFQPDSGFAVRDVVVDFEGAGVEGGDVLRLSGSEFAWVGRIDVTPRTGAAIPGGGDGLTQLGYIQGNGRTFLVADTDDDGGLDKDDFAVEFQGLHDFTPEDFDNTDFIIAGTNGDDVITGTEEDDRIFAAGGDDQVFALGGSDEVHGGTGADFLDGGPGGFDELFGDAGNDELTLATSDFGGNAEGGDGDDVLFGSDTEFSFSNLQGGAGDDDLHAGAAGSNMNGDSGADRLISSAADDQMGAGRDEVTFALDNAPDLFVYTGPGRWSTEGSFFGDTVSAFQDGSDRFDLGGSGLVFADLTIVNDDFQTTITSDRGTITIFENFDEPVVIDENDFLFS